MLVSGLAMFISPLTPVDEDDFNPYRGNKFEKFYKNSQGEVERDTMGRLKKMVVPDSEAVNRRNYQKGDVINFLDGDSISSVTYGYGITSLISDKSRVIKGGSWNDMPYWLSPGASRYIGARPGKQHCWFPLCYDKAWKP